ncbi:MAG: hypothetical protein E4H43_01650, partial [Bacteroidia bacterium]
MLSTFQGEKIKWDDLALHVFAYDQACKWRTESWIMTSVFGNIGLATPIMDQKNELSRKLVYRTLGKTGMRVPVIG